MGFLPITASTSSLSAAARIHADAPVEKPMRTIFSEPLF